MEKPCIFCGKDFSRKKTREHIVPEWLEDFLKINDEEIQPTHYTSRGDIKSIRKHPIDQFLCGGICNICNNGWMSELEQENMDLLKKLMDGSIQVFEIWGTKEAERISAWSCKTAFSLHAASNYRTIIPVEHFRSISGFNGSIPTRVWVFAKTCKSDRKFSWNQSSTWKTLAQKGLCGELEKKILYEKGYKIFLQFGSLFLLVAFNPFKNTQSAKYQFILNLNLHTNLYPKKGPCSWSESSIVLPNDTISAGFTYSFELGMAFLDPIIGKREKIEVGDDPMELIHLDHP